MEGKSQYGPGNQPSTTMIFCSELRWGKAIVAYTKPQHRKRRKRKAKRRERSDPAY